MPLSFFPTHPFQPTLPARGATFPSHEVVKTGVKISTHAPRTGSDHLYAIGKLRLCIISTHAPRTGSDYKGFSFYGRTQSISTHAPRTGSDEETLNSLRATKISTHAPRTGSDHQRGFGRAENLHAFQPTLPARGATT